MSATREAGKGLPGDFAQRGRTASPARERILSQEETPRLEVLSVVPIRMCRMDVSYRQARWGAQSMTPRWVG